MPYTRLAYPKYKVFIFGVEVTEDVVAVSTEQHDGNAPSICQLSLVSKNDKYVINTTDMMILGNVKSKNGLTIPWLDNSYEARGLDKKTVGTTLDTDRGVAAYKALSELKWGILDRKHAISETIDISQRTGPTGKPIGQEFWSHYSSKVPKWPLADGGFIFHPMDPVRVFMRDPYDVSKWYWHFTGYVTDISETISENHEKIVSIQVEDVRKLFRYTRVAVNPGVVDAKSRVYEEDLQVRSFNQNYFSGFSLPEVAFSILFGSEIVSNVRELVTNLGVSENSKTRMRGIGHFSYGLSGIFTYGPDSQETESQSRSPATLLHSAKSPTKLESLAEWQALLAHEVSVADLWILLRDDLKGIQSVTSSILASVGDLSSPDIIEKVINYIGTHIDRYLVDGGRLLMLLPTSLGVDNRNILARDIIGSYPLQTETISAGEALFTIVQRIDFCTYSTPRGDIVVEPPFYDFDPDDFGMSQIPKDRYVALLQMTAISTNDTLSKEDEAYLENKIRINIPTPIDWQKMFNEARDSFAKIQSDMKANMSMLDSMYQYIDTVGPFGTSYVVHTCDTVSIEHMSSDEKVQTVAQVPSALVQHWENIGYSDIIGKLKVIRLEELIPLYGVRVLPITPMGYIGSPEAAKLYGEVMLGRANADAHTVKITHTPNLGMWLNRPIYIEKRNFLATTKKISHNLTWSSDMTTTLDLNSVRLWNGSTRPDNAAIPQFKHIGVGASRHLDYKLLFSKRTSSSLPSPYRRTDGDNKPLWENPKFDGTK